MTDTPTSETSAVEAPVVLTPPPVTTVAASKKKSSVVNPYHWGTGRRKAAVARVRIRPGEGKFIVNKKELNEYFRLAKDQSAARKPLDVTDTGKTMDVYVNVCGGGTTGQAGAVLLGVARALMKANADHGTKLKELNLLSRDPRRVERKKPGQPGARKRFQFSKR
jgi:small subunit ribosomal protein S9